MTTTSRSEAPGRTGPAHADPVRTAAGHSRAARTDSSHAGPAAGRAGPAPALPGPGPAARLLDGYRPGAEAFFFASPTRTLLTGGVHTAIPHGPAPLARRVADALAAAGADGTRPDGTGPDGARPGGGRLDGTRLDGARLDGARPDGARPDGERIGVRPGPLVVGAVPFDHGAPARLVIPRRVRLAGPLHREAPALPPPPDPRAGDAAGWTVVPEPTREEYERAVGEAVRRLRAGELDKVVLARTLRLAAPRRVGIAPMLRRLALRDPHGYTFAVPAGGGRTLVGASPELLVSRRGGRITANPLAGSAPRADDLTEDVVRAADLLRSDKDRHEHALVVAAVRAALAPYCRTLTVPDEPSLVRTGAMWHLSTTVTGEPLDPSVSALELATALHPTPAVCGTPADAARRLIGELEPFDRGLFTGVVGWGDARGDGEWVVTLRCGEVDGSRVRVYAGAGIVADSLPAAEHAETSAKFGTFLRALGIDHAP